MIMVKEILRSLLIILVTVEIFALVMVKFFNYTSLWYKYPTYTYWGPTVKEVYDPLGPHYIDNEDVSWATWHIPNTEIRHKGDCYDVLMKFNEVGARGELPSKSDSNTVIFLGDSFIEGFALAENETIPAQYNQFTKLPTLNLGGGGSFGTTQMAMIYDSLGKVFTHKKVIVCLYLENDFVDDDISQYYPGRYRPYLVQSADNQNYKLIYKESIEQSFAKKDAYKKGQTIENIKKYSLPDFFKLTDKTFMQKLAGLTYSSRFFMEVFYRAQNKNNLPMELRSTKSQQKLLKYNLEKIVKYANKNHAEVYVTNIPSKYLLASLESQPENKAKVDRVIQDALSDTHAPYLDFTGYLISKKPNLQEIFYPCDSHFNPKGAFLLSEYLLYHTKVK